jgi:kynurenine formamidase
MRYIDLSATLDNDSHWAPWWARNRVKRQSHRFGRFAVRLIFGLGPKYLRNRLGWANEVIELSTHGTTHVDAPWHYSPVCDGKPARTIDELPLEWFHGPGVVIDISYLDSPAAATVDEIKTGLADAGHELRPGDIVLIRTGNDRLLGSRDYFDAGPGVSAEATRWLIDRGVRLMGIDAWGWDAPLKQQAREAKRSGREDLFWSAHFVGVDREYCQIERLANLGSLPSTGFTVCAFPLKVKDGSAGPARVVAMMEE